MVFQPQLTSTSLLRGISLKLRTTSVVPLPESFTGFHCGINPSSLCTESSHRVRATSPAQCLLPLGTATVQPAATALLCSARHHAPPGSLLGLSITPHPTDANNPFLGVHALSVVLWCSSLCVFQPQQPGAPGLLSQQSGVGRGWGRC